LKKKTGGPKIKSEKKKQKKSNHWKKDGKGTKKWIGLKNCPEGLAERGRVTGGTCYRKTVRCKKGIGSVAQYPIKERSQGSTEKWDKVQGKV